VTREDDSETKGALDGGTVSDSRSKSLSEPQALLGRDNIPKLDRLRPIDKYVWEDYVRHIHEASGRTNLPRHVEEDVVRETAPSGVKQQSIQQSARRRVTGRSGRAKEDFLKEAEQRGVKQDLLREAALSPVDELLAWEELPRRVADVFGSEEARELISQDPSLWTPPRRVAEEPLWLFGSEI
jgi:hypothetical protein